MVNECPQNTGTRRLKCSSGAFLSTYFSRFCWALPSDSSAIQPFYIAPASHFITTLTTHGPDLTRLFVSYRYDITLTIFLLAQTKL